MTEIGFIALFSVLVFLLTLSLSFEGNSFAATDSGPGLLIKQRVTEWRPLSKAVIGGERIYFAVLVEAFYEGRNYQNAWSQDGLLFHGGTLIRAIEESYNDGLTPVDYHLELIKSIVNKARKELPPDPILLSDLDLLLTEAFLSWLSPVRRVRGPSGCKRGMVCKAR